MEKDCSIEKQATVLLDSMDASFSGYTDAGEALRRRYRLPEHSTIRSLEFLCHLVHVDSGGALRWRYCFPGLAQARPVALDTRLPVSYGPGKQYRHPSFISMEFIHQKPLAHAYARSRGCAVPYFRTLSDRDVAPERTWMYLQQVLK